MLIFICISLMMTEVEHLSKSCLAICVSSEKGLFRSHFAHFGFWWFFQVLSFRASLYILDIDLLADTRLENVVSQSVGCLSLCG